MKTITITLSDNGAETGRKCKASFDMPLDTWHLTVNRQGALAEFFRKTVADLDDELTRILDQPEPDEDDYYRR